jgi:hypothetical protein
MVAAQRCASAAAREQHSSWRKKSTIALGKLLPTSLPHALGFSIKEFFSEIAFWSAASARWMRPFTYEATLKLLEK